MSTQIYSKENQQIVIKCRNCESQNYIKQGYRKTENRGKIQKYFCKDCNNYFTNDDGFYRMRNNENKVTASMDMYYSGMSFRKIQSHLQMFAPHNCNFSTIYRWVVKYAEMISKVTDKLQMEHSGQELMSDEMEYNRLGEQNWFVDTLDTTTRYMASSGFIKSRTNEVMIPILKLAKVRTGNNIKVVTTDALIGYPTILSKTFGYHKKTFNKDYVKSHIIHNIVKADERGFNHKIERLHGTIRDRTKIMRGFHGSIDSAKAIMKGYEIYYNYVRKHQGIDNKTPQQEAIPTLDLGVNKWLSLIKMSRI